MKLVDLVLPEFDPGIGHDPSSARNAEGCVYVADIFNHRIQKFSQHCAHGRCRRFVEPGQGSEGGHERELTYTSSSHVGPASCTLEPFGQ
jgi:hypothetical protein